MQQRKSSHAVHRLIANLDALQQAVRLKFSSPQLGWLSFEPPIESAVAEGPKQARVLSIGSFFFFCVQSV
jgi:hypothetical protein